jgi:hypothetical protein
MGCSPGSYAYPCYGGRIPQIACVSCQTLDILFHPQDRTFDYWPSRFFIPYTSHALLRGIVNNQQITFDTLSKYPNSIVCPTTCISNSIFFNGSCISCDIFISIMFPNIPKNAPYNRFYSTWNASDAIRWWPQQFDPPFYSKRSYNPFTNSLIPDKRYGICWPCPSTEPVVINTPTTDSNHICFHEIDKNTEVKIAPNVTEQVRTIYISDISATNVNILSKTKNVQIQVKKQVQ